MKMGMFNLSLIHYSTIPISYNEGIMKFHSVYLYFTVDKNSVPCDVGKNMGRYGDTFNIFPDTWI